MKNILMPLTLVLAMSSSVYAEGLFERPFATCASIKSLGAYKTALAVVNACQKYGVSIDHKNATSSFNDMLGENEFSPSKCRKNCLVLKTLNQTEMSECVENSHVDPFVNGFMGSLTFNKGNCEIMKGKLGG